MLWSFISSFSQWFADYSFQALIHHLTGFSFSSPWMGYQQPSATRWGYWWSSSCQPVQSSCPRAHSDFRQRASLYSIPAIGKSLGLALTKIHQSRFLDLGLLVGFRKIWIPELLPFKCSREVKWGSWHSLVILRFVASFPSHEDSALIDSLFSLGRCCLNTRFYLKFACQLLEFLSETNAFLSFFE